MNNTRFTIGLFNRGMTHYMQMTSNNNPHNNVCIYVLTTISVLKITSDTYSVSSVRKLSLTVPSVYFVRINNLWQDQANWTLSVKCAKEIAIMYVGNDLILQKRIGVAGHESRYVAALSVKGRHV